MKATATYSLAAALLLVGAAGFGTSNAEEPTSRVLELPRSAGSGAGKEVSVLLDESHLKLATVTLRKGTKLPPHNTPVPTTIQVLQGEGVIHIGSKPVSVSRGTIVSLVAGEQHDVVPKPGGDMLLLVHYLRGAARAGTSPPAVQEH